MAATSAGSVRLYQVSGLSGVIHARRNRRAVRFALPAVGRNVVYLGLTSMFTDISSEMVSSILPVYLVLYVGLNPLQFGVVDGVYRGVTAMLLIAGSMAADRWHRHREIAAAGYAVSALSKVGLLAAGGVWTAVVGAVFMDRAGKAVRTAPRDALIALSTPRGDLGSAFGVHRALDSAGSLLGPLAAFGILALLPRAFDVVFVASFCAALVGLAILGLFVENRPPALQEERTASLRPALEALAAPRYRALLLAGTALSLCTMSDGFLYLAMQQQQGFNPGYVPLLYVATAAVYSLVAVPLGRLADTVGRKRVLMGGYAALLVTYGVLLAGGTGPAATALCLLAFGLYYAGTSGVLMALAAEGLPEGAQASGMAVLTTAASLAGLVGSMFLGAVWAWWGLSMATAVILGGLLLALILAVRVLPAQRGAAA